MVGVPVRREVYGVDVAAGVDEVDAGTSGSETAGEVWIAMCCL